VKSLTSTLDGTRVLVVEDELLVAMMIEEALQLAGCVILGPISDLPQALRAAREQVIDVALLDVNLAGARVFPVAAVLAERSVPYVFMTGYGRGMLPVEYANRPTIGKPFKLRDLTDSLSAALRAANARGR
jgi:DNA-binding response OmpR family regulator